MGNISRLCKGEKKEPKLEQSSSNSDQRETDMVQTGKTSIKNRKSNIPSSNYAQQVNNHVPLTKLAKITLEQLGQESKNTANYVLKMNYPIYIIKQQQSTYQGPFQGRLPHGKGIAHFRDGSYYSGNFRQGQADGSGIYIYKNGSVYFGNFKKSIFNGFGTMRDSQKRSQYSGDWQEGLPEGNGQEVFWDNSSYKGDYVKGLKHGLGQYQWADGRKYIGQFRKNSINGKGVLTDENGQILYKGEFIDGMKNGPGFLHTKEGTYYGEFKNDFLEGKGVFVWKDKKVYIGDFKKTKFDGKGLILYENDTIAEVTWKDNEKISIGTENYSYNNRQKFKALNYELSLAQAIIDGNYEGRDSNFYSKLIQQRQQYIQRLQNQQQSSSVSINNNLNRPQSEQQMVI